MSTGSGRSSLRWLGSCQPQVPDRLGHSVRLTLEIYARAAQASDREAPEVLSTSLRPRLRLVDDEAPRDERAMEPAGKDARDDDQASGQHFDGGRGGTRTPDICLVRAAL
jgi:hypothetical protein